MRSLGLERFQRGECGSLLRRHFGVQWALACVHLWREAALRVTAADRPKADLGLTSRGWRVLTRIGRLRVSQKIKPTLIAFGSAWYLGAVERWKVAR